MGLRDAVYGLAVGDALGVPYEFMPRGSFEVAPRMMGGGAHGQLPGTFSDDTSMTLATCDSIKANGGKIDVADMRNRFIDWARNGRYTPDGSVFDIGCTVSSSLSEGRGRFDVMSNGNGSLMRIVPLACTNARDEDIAAASAITHAHSVSTSACIEYVRIARRLEAGESVASALNGAMVGDAPFDPSKPIDSIKSSGYVLHTLEAALWCLANTASYAECVTLAVSLGSDTDTTAAVAGAIAGIAYGSDGIPASWMDALRGKSVIESVL